jgi:hypothetical protein
VDFRSGSRRVGLVDPDRVRERLGRLEPLLALLDEVRASGEHAYFSAELGLPPADDYGVAISS